MVVFFVGTKEAARLLGISQTRVRALLKQKRIRGAYKITESCWAIPVYEKGMPSVIRGTRGPKPRWKSYRANAKTIIHAYKNHIGKKDDKGIYLAPIAVKNSSKGNYSAYEIDIPGPSKLIYNPEHPSPCGAKLWIETLYQVRPIGQIKPPPNSRKKASGFG